MEAYTGFATVYDLFMDNIPYQDWCAYVTSLLKRTRRVGWSGSGSWLRHRKTTRLLAAEGYDTIGVDLSEEMLEVAPGTRDGRSKQILYLQAGHAGV